MRPATAELPLADRRDGGTSQSGKGLAELYRPARISSLEPGLEAMLNIPRRAIEVVDGANADVVRTRVAVEDANVPVSAKAYAVLAERGVTIVQDILARAGAVSASHFERIQRSALLTGATGGVARLLINHLEQGLVAVRAFAKRASGLHEAALALGIRRVSDLHLGGGRYP